MNTLQCKMVSVLPPWVSVGPFEEYTGNRSELLSESSGKYARLKPKAHCWKFTIEQSQ